MIAHPIGSGGFLNMRGPILRAAISLMAAMSVASAEEKLGVVLMHGKQSAPEQHELLASAIAAAGFPVERPEMCWSGRRIYDRDYPGCLRDIDSAVDRLRQRGATALVIAGHSLGANGALAYGARNTVKGVVALAPGHRPEVLARRPRIAEDLERARRLVAEGRGDRPTGFADYNGSLVITVTATPVAYLSFFAPDSPAVMLDNAARLKAPLLYVVGNGDPLQRGPEEIFAKAPPHTLNRYITVQAGHFDTSAAAAGAVVEWLRLVGQR
jgi:pimeloyl-ACP methyl ester carboxylesterase